MTNGQAQTKKCPFSNGERGRRDKRSSSSFFVIVKQKEAVLSVTAFLYTPDRVMRALLSRDGVRFATGAEKKENEE